MVRRNPDGFSDDQDEFGTRVVEGSKNGQQAVEANGTSQTTPLETL
jgi:hypothetical protein